MKMETDESINELFLRFYNDWIQYTNTVQKSSSLAVILNNESYENVIKLGKPVLPLIMERIRNGEFLLNAAAARITRANPFPPEIDSRILSEQKKSEFWLKWWEKNKDRPEWKVGFRTPIKAFVEIKLRPGTDPYQSLQIMKELKGVKEAYVVTGHPDIVISIEVEKIFTVFNIITEGIKPLKGVQSTTMMIVAQE